MGSKNKKNLKKKNKLSPQKLLKQQKAANPTNAFDPKKLITIIGILIFTFVAFSPSLNNGFVNWDDDKNFYENDNITTLTDSNFWSNTVKIFKSDVIGGYNPLSIWSFLIEHKIFGLDQPTYWHLDNILLHLVCVFFVFWIAIRMRLGYFGAIILSLLFAVHPMRVESVAWITERKDVLFGAFYLAAMFYYIKGKQDGFKTKYWIIIAICFALSLLSKIQAVIFPVSMILVDCYLSKSGKITFKSILNKWPLLLGSLFIGCVNIYFLKNQGSITQQEYHGIDRLFIGTYSLSIYYIKSLVPFRMSPLYPYPASLGWEFYASIISLVGTCALLYYSYIKKWKVLFFGLGFFMVNIVLLLQIVGAGQGFLADRFTYIAYFGLFFIIAYYLNQLVTTKTSIRIPVLATCSIVFLGYAVMTFNQNKIWKDSGTLWSHVLKYYQKSTLPWGNRANFNRDNGNVQQALFDYNKVIRLKPNEAKVYNSLARLYFNFNNRDSLLKALNFYNKAIELKPADLDKRTHSEYVVNRGATYAKLGDMNNALINMNAAEKIDPSFVNIYLNRSVIYNQQSNYRAALTDIDKYLSYKPNFPDMWYEKCRLHNALNEYQKGLEAINQAIAMEQKGIFYFERAKCYFVAKNIPQAQNDIKTAESLGYKGDQTVINKIFNQ